MGSTRNRGSSGYTGAVSSAPISPIRFAGDINEQPISSDVNITKDPEIPEDPYKNYDPRLKTINLAFDRSGGEDWGRTDKSADAFSAIRGTKDPESGLYKRNLERNFTSIN